MDTKMTDITLHINEPTSHDDREALRDSLLGLDGVMAAAYHDEKPHLMMIEYDPDVINSTQFLTSASDRGLHAQLIGL